MKRFWNWLGGLVFTIVVGAIGLTYLCVIMPDNVMKAVDVIKAIFGA